MQIKTTMRYHLTLVRVAITKKFTNNTGEDTKNRKPCTLLVGMQIRVATVENSMEVPQKKLKIELPYDPAIPLLCIYVKKIKTLI